jgi:hypothetical protein
MHFTTADARAGKTESLRAMAKYKGGRTVEAHRTARGMTGYTQSSIDTLMWALNIDKYCAQYRPYLAPNKACLTIAMIVPSYTSCT